MKLNDRPGRLPQDDDLDRVHFAEMIANQVRLLDSSEGCVVGITGPWGSGKSTVLYLMEPFLKNNGNGYVVWFNPWFFSSTDDLVGRFFQQLSIALSLEPKFKSIAEGAADFGTALTPMKELANLAGPIGFLPAIAKIPKKAMEIWQGGVEKQKGKLSEALRRSETDFYFVMDDIDRLDSQEIRDIAKLVRLTGNLPRVTYILAYDRQRVEQALTDSGLSGREYLEKIIFASYDVLQIHSSHVRRVLESSLSDLLARSDVPDIADDRRSYEVMSEVLLSRITNLRNAKRFVASCGPTVSQLAQDVDVLDLLCLEVLRILDPDVFKSILENYRLLSWSEEDSQIFTPSRNKLAGEAVKSVLSVNNDQATTWILRNLFPIAWQKHDDRSSPSQNFAQMRRDRRVGHQHFMTLYAARFEDRGVVARRRAEEVVGLKPSIENYDRLFDSLEIDEVADIADILTEMTSRFPNDALVLLTVSLLAQAGKEVTRRRRFFDFGVAQAARVVLARLLEEAPNQNRSDLVDQVYGAVQSFENKYQVLKVAESEDGSGRPLLAREETLRLNLIFAADFGSADSQQLSAERCLLLLAREVMERTGASPSDLPDFLSTPSVSWAFLRSSVQESLNAQTEEERYVMDVVAVDKVLGGRQRTLELIGICRTCPSGREDDALYLQAADLTVSRLNRAVFGGDLGNQPSDDDQASRSCTKTG